MNCFVGRNQHRNPHVPTPDYNALLNDTNFTKKELKGIFSRFQGIAGQDTGTLNKKDFLAIPEVAFCPIAELVFEKETVARNKDNLDFDEFISIMSVFSASAPPQEKLKYLYLLMKDPEARLITKESFAIVIKRIAGGSHVPEAVLNEMVNTAWPHISQTDDLAPQHFQKLMSYFDLHSVMTIDI